MWRLSLIVSSACTAFACGGMLGPAALDPVSSAEATAVAQAFDAAMIPCDPAAMDQLLDAETMFRRGAAAADVPLVAKVAYIAGAGSASLGTGLCSGIGGEAGARFDLLQIREVEGQPRPLFRLLRPSGVNYFELELGKSKADGVVRVVDLYVYAVGDTMSVSFTEALESTHAGAQAGEDVAAGVDTMTALVAAAGAGDGPETLRLYAALPERMQAHKSVRLLELKGALMLDDDTYGAVIERYEKSYPNDPSLDLMSIDGFFLRKDLPALMATIDRLDQRLGGDPYLSVMRSNGLQLRPTPENLAEAERHGKLAVDALPDFELAWWALGSARLQLEDHAGAVQVFQRLESEFSIVFNLEAMRGEPIYAAFLRSAEFQTWWDGRGR